MNIDRVVMPCGPQPEYRQYIPLVTRAWSNLGFETHIVETTSMDYRECLVALLLALQHEKGTALISDVDMMPLTEAYFRNVAALARDDELVIYSSDGYEQWSTGLYPACYMLAHGRVWAELLNPYGLSDTELRAFWKAAPGTGNPCDLRFSYEVLLQWLIWDKWKNRRLALRRRGFEGGAAYARIDRAAWEWQDGGYYIDAHLPRAMEPWHRIPELLATTERR